MKPAEEKEPEKKTQSGIILPGKTPSEQKKKRTLGVIVTLPTEEVEELKHLKEGDKVLYSTIGNDTVTIKGEEHLMVPAENLLAVWQKIKK